MSPRAALIAALIAALALAAWAAWLLNVPLPAVLIGAALVAAAAVGFARRRARNRSGRQLGGG